jgi:hypothetical protein
VEDIGTQVIKFTVYCELSQNVFRRAEGGPLRFGDLGWPFWWSSTQIWPRFISHPMITLLFFQPSHVSYALNMLPEARERFEMKKDIV